MDTNTLQSNIAVQLTEQQGAFIVCEEGQLWLTDNGDDIVLAHGERYQIQGEQPVVIESLRTSSRFRLESVRILQASQFAKLHDMLHRLLHAPRQPNAHA